MRDFDPTQDQLLHPDGTTAQQRVTLPGTQEGALLQPGRREGEEKQGGKRFRVFPILINKETELIQATDVNNHLLTLCTRFSHDHNDQSFCCNICIPTLETCRHSDCFYICSLPPDFKATEGK